MTRRLTRLIFLTLLSFASGSAAMLLFLRPARADPVIAMTPTGLELSWQAWLVLGLAAAGGALKILDVAIAGLKWLAPRTKTTLDDRGAADLQIVRDDIAAVLKVVGGLVPAAGVPATAADRPAGPVLIKSGTGTAAILVVLLLGAAGGGLALSSCAATTAAGHAAKPAIINCTAQDLGTAPALNLETLVAVANTVAAERAACMTAGGLDWKCVERDAIGKGLVLGGCALAEMVAAAANALHPAGPGLVAGDPAPPPGRAELERFRAQVAGGATYHTAAGDL